MKRHTNTHTLTHTRRHCAGYLPGPVLCLHVVVMIQRPTENPHRAVAESQAVKVRKDCWVAREQPDCSYDCAEAGGLGPANE